ncbi:protein-export chaperone SecB [Elioraea sp.]|uniref:protein-export chaperone SecB n=1 Tax=Elioraea sp. TaxID=2185103 RepID=UPI003F70F055
MNETTGNGNGKVGGDGQAGATPPGLLVNLQYVKDLSFEVPGAPDIFVQMKQQPEVAINLDVNARQVAQGSFEVVLSIRAEAKSAGKAAFIAELDYAGIFTLNNIPQELVEPVLLVEAPRLLFPFARNIVAEVTREGGFPPVMLQPIDFLALWQSRKQQQAGGADPAAPPPVANA